MLATLSILEKDTGARQSLRGLCASFVTFAVKSLARRISLAVLDGDKLSSASRQRHAPSLQFRATAVPVQNRGGTSTSAVHSLMGLCFPQFKQCAIANWVPQRGHTA